MAKRSHGDDEPARSGRFIDDPDQWPNWPWLSLKRYHKTATGGTGIQCAIVRARSSASEPHVVKVANIWGKGPDENTPTFEYPTTAALLADGWIVD